jgi:Zn-dependent protease with chaperone function
MLLWNLPPGLAGWSTEHRYGFSHQNLAGYLQDVGLNAVLNLFNVLLIWGAYRLYTAWPRYWWLVLWGLMTPLTIFFMIVQPVVIAPLYNHFTPLKSGPTRDDLLALAAKAGISGANVYVTDTSRRTAHVNAYVTGIGPTTRIVLNDTALRSLSEPQLLAVMGHEMGHYVEGHVWILTVAAVSIGFVSLWLASYLLPWIARHGARVLHIRGVTDLAALPLLFLVISLFTFLTLPVFNGLSRVLEHRADAFSLRLTHLNEPMIQAFIGFAERDYSDPDPPALWQFWYGSHPSLKQRIQFARSFPISGN